MPPCSPSGSGCRSGTPRSCAAWTWRVPGSGITVVLGASGSGKSTLTRLCNRLLDPSSGTVSLRGTDVRQLDVLELRRAVGMVFQRPTVFDGTVCDNLEATGVTDGGAHARYSTRSVSRSASSIETRPRSPGAKPNGCAWRGPC